MSTPPDISVVMGVRNGADQLPATMESVLNQDIETIELIMVDDGSTDGRIGSILDAAARRDGRVRPMRQAAAGLTRALQAGCAAASGRVLARVDVGDRCLPGRLRAELTLLDQHPDVRLVSCGTRYVYDDGTVLFEDLRHDSAEDATRRLRERSFRRARSLTHHGSAMFRRADYEAVGGYREAFYFAQDIDLWLRLTDHGSVAFVPEVGYEARIGSGSLSARNSRAQSALAELAYAMCRRRAAGQDERDLLDRARRIGPAAGGIRARMGMSRGDYFVGCLLRARGHGDARAHFARAVRANPAHLKAWLRLMGCPLGREGGPV